ncbi:MAG: amidohydrolase family protein [Pseudomonadota bacterium]|nr:amidohydrolase family protein [Pseudomonadota bacterium]
MLPQFVENCLSLPHFAKLCISDAQCAQVLRGAAGCRDSQLIVGNCLLVPATLVCELAEKVQGGWIAGHLQKGSFKQPCCLSIIMSRQKDAADAHAGIFLDLTPTFNDGLWTKIHETITVSPAVRSENAAFDDRARKQAAVLVQRVLKSGVKFAAGSDMCWFYPGKTRGQASATMFTALRKAGMPPLDIIRAVTVNAAEMLGWQDRVGSVEPGKLADLAAVAGDPIADTSELNHTFSGRASAEQAKLLLEGYAVHDWVSDNSLVFRALVSDEQETLGALDDISDHPRSPRVVAAPKRYAYVSSGLKESLRNPAGSCARVAEESR